MKCKFHHTPELLELILLHWRGTRDTPISLHWLKYSLGFSPPRSVFLTLSPVDETWAEHMWNIYSALAQSTTAAHTLYLPWREILSALPLPLTPPESLSPHWPELSTDYMSHCSTFTATLKPAARVPSARLFSTRLKEQKQVQHELSCGLCAWLRFTSIWVLIEEVMPIHF